MTGSLEFWRKNNMAGNANIPNSLAIFLSSILTKLMPAPSASSSICSISANTLGHCLQSSLTTHGSLMFRLRNAIQDMQIIYKRKPLDSRMFVEFSKTFSDWLVQCDRSFPYYRATLTSRAPPLRHQYLRRNWCVCLINYRSFVYVKRGLT